MFNGAGDREEGREGNRRKEDYGHFSRMSGLRPPISFAFTSLQMWTVSEEKPSEFLMEQMTGSWGAPSLLLSCGQLEDLKERGTFHRALCAPHTH